MVKYGTILFQFLFLASCTFLDQSVPVIDAEPNPLIYSSDSIYLRVDSIFPADYMKNDTIYFFGPDWHRLRYLTNIDQKLIISVTARIEGLKEPMLSNPGFLLFRGVNHDFGIYKVTVTMVYKFPPDQLPNVLNLYNQSIQRIYTLNFQKAD